MTREIKFRAWDKDNCFMVTSENLMDENEYFFDIDNFGKISLLQLQRTHIDDEEKTAVQVNSELMQYTCLKDKNGKEIYEGDIVKGKTTLPMQIFWRGWQWVVIYTDFSGTQNEKIDAEFVRYMHDEEWEIMGNIYENPELLK